MKHLNSKIKTDLNLMSHIYCNSFSTIPLLFMNSSLNEVRSMHSYLPAENPQKKAVWDSKLINLEMLVS